MAKSKKTSDAFDMADDIRKEVAAESVADACREITLVVRNTTRMQT